jgi:hypothetical protein
MLNDLMAGDRALRALEAVLPPGAHVHVVEQIDRDSVVELAGLRLRLRWLTDGRLRQGREALSRDPMPDLIAAPELSPGARNLARDCGVGWLDETGAAEISIEMLLVSRSVATPPVSDSGSHWRPATLAVCEALLVSSQATVAAVAAHTGLAVSTVVESLKFLDHNGLLEAEAGRGRLSGRRVKDRNALLDAYATAAEQVRPITSLRMGALWRDPIQGVIEAGKRWRAAGTGWAATGALPASVIAPALTELAPIEIYITSRTIGDLRKSAEIGGLREMDGGRILLRPFPTPASDTITNEVVPGLFSVLWPRIYADLRTVGVRGEDAAEHLREEMSRASERSTGN